ncbi:MAG: hypothetical protein FWH17_06605 [Oscillospiraceae bacterium]|nr:hypothetical protein [Oscillospiraceae bacterium]
MDLKRFLSIVLVCVSYIAFLSGCSNIYDSLGTEEDEIITEAIMDKGIKLPWESDWSSAISIVPGLPIILDYPADNASFDISVSAGSFISWSDAPLSPGGVHDEINQDKFLGQNFTLHAPCTIYWRDIEWGSYDNITSYEGSFHVFPDKAYVDIIIKDGQNIVGFVVIEIYQTKPSVYIAGLLKSVFFPKNDGEYQKVDYKWVANEIAAVKEG